jgi:ammonia channel protein AmtB
MTAIGFILLFIGWLMLNVGDGLFKELDRPDWYMLVCLLALIFGLALCVAGLAAYLWRVMP